MSSKVSIIIPVYNAENTVARCVNSIFKGTFQDIEVILVDDCSKDKSWNECCDLAQQFANVICYQNEHNAGVSYTRNYGLEKAKGEYILFVDSDDWVKNDYVEKMLSAAELHSDELVICGLHFINEVEHYERDYLWQESGDSHYTVEQQSFFELSKRFQLQQLWNKIFRRDIINQYCVRFDETQSMGEDYEFVLDYMRVADIKRCFVINEPLYFYIRANSSSLMSKFGLTGIENDERRMKKLFTLTGNDNENRQQYLSAITDIKKNAIYQMMHSTEHSRNDKLKFIETIMKDGKSKKYYYDGLIVIAKERFAKFIRANWRRNR